MNFWAFASATLAFASDLIASFIGEAKKSSRICMRILIPASVDKALGLALTKLQKISGVKKPVLKFLCRLLQQWLVLPLRHNFSTLARFGGYSDRAIRDQFSKKLPFLSLFHQLFDPHLYFQER